MKSILLVRQLVVVSILVSALSFLEPLQAQISPSAPTREYIRLGDRVLAIEQGAPPSNTVPDGWTTGDVGTTCTSDSTTYSQGQYTMVAGGISGLGNGSGSDNVRFASMPVTGDATIVARVTHLVFPGTSNVSAAGIMLRTSLTGSSAYAFVGIAINQQVFRTRATTSAASTSSYGSAYYLSSSTELGLDLWLKLVRTGNSIAASISENGVDWNSLGSPLTTITASTIYAGVAVAGPSCANAATGTVDNVTVSQNTADFFLTSVPTSVVSSSAGDTSSYSIGVNPLYGFSSSVNLSLAGLPPSVSWAFQPTSVAPPGITTLTISAPPGTPAETYPFTINSSGGGVSHTAYGTYTVSTPVGGTLPELWTGTTVGTPCQYHSAGYANGVFTVTSTGIFATAHDADYAFEYVYVPVTGDVTLIARITTPSFGFTFQPGGAFGLMLRTGPDTAASFAMIGVGTPSSVREVEFLSRSSNGAGLSAPTYGNAFNAPYWFKLVRSGTNISGYVSPNGIDWPSTPLGTLTGVTASQMYVGMMAAAGYACSVNTATVTFDNVTLSGGSGAGTNPDFSIGVPAGVATVNAGGEVSIPTTITPTDGFSGTVQFSIDQANSSLPPLVNNSVVFSPPSITERGTDQAEILYQTM